MNKDHRFYAVFVAFLATALLLSPVFAENKADPSELIKELKKGGDAREKARKKLIKLGKDAVPALIEATNSEDVWVRWEAVNALGYIKDDRAIPALVERALVDENPHPRWRSLWALSVFPKEEILPGLRKGLDGKSQRVRWNAVVALAFFENKRAVPKLNQALFSAKGDRLWEAVFSLSKVHNQKSVELLSKILTDRGYKSRIRQEAANTLTTIADESSAPALINALNDPDPGVRWRAANALTRLSKKKALPKIQTSVQELRKKIEEIKNTLAGKKEGEKIKLESKLERLKFAVEQMSESIKSLKE